MKIFNEVVAEHRGVVLEVLVEAGQLVHTGDALMLIDGTSSRIDAETTA